MLRLGLTLVLFLLAAATPACAQLLAAVLPSARSVQVGTPATAFATIINAGSSTALGCSIAPATSVPATFVYQTTNPATNAVTGAANTPVDIVAGGSQTFVFAFTPTAAFGGTDVQLTFACANATPAPVVSGLNTLLLAGSSILLPDVVAVAATLTNDGIATGFTSAFTVATTNVGASAGMYVSADTGSAVLPITIKLCQTNPATGACISPLTSTSIVVNMPAGSTAAFGVFVSSAVFISFDPAVNRVFVRFREEANPCYHFVCFPFPSAGDIRGSTSVAVRTQ
jgi:hypothetical protein